MPIRSLNLHHTHHTALFDALTQLVREFATLAADSDPRLLLELDLRLAQGCMTSFQFSIGRSGALACSLFVVRQDGHIHEFMNIDAPPTDKPFSFVTPAEGT
jgi:hypothetical protein